MSRRLRWWASPVLTLGMLAGLVAPAVAQQAPTPPASIQTITVPGEHAAGRWDFMQVDPNAHRLYVSDSSNGTLDVLDLNSFTFVAQIPGLPNRLEGTSWSGSNGLALAPELGRAWVADEVDNSLHVYDTNSLTQIAVVSTTQSGSDSVAYDPAEKKVFVSNGDSNTITVFDAQTNAVLDQIKLPGAPEIAIWDRADGMIHQNLSDTNQQAIVDPKTDKVTTVFNLPLGCEPHGIGLDPNTNHLIIGCKQQMTAIIDGKDGTVLAVSKHTGGSDIADYNPATNRFYVASANDVSTGKAAPVVGVYAASGTYDWLGNGKTDRGAHSLAVDAGTGVVYVGAGGAGKIYVFPPSPVADWVPADPAMTTKVDQTFTAIDGAASGDIMEVDQQAQMLYFAVRMNAKSTAGGVVVYDVSGGAPQQVAFVDLGSGGNGVVTAPDLKKIFVGLTDSSVAVVDVNPGSRRYLQQIARIGTGGAQRTDELDYDPVDRKVYAANSDDGLVTVIDAVGNSMITQFTDLGEGLEQPRYDPADGMMYMTSSDQNAIFQFDPTTDTLVNKFDVGNNCNPNGIAINPNTNQAMLGCSISSSHHAVLWDLGSHSVVSTSRNTGRIDGAIYDGTADRFLLASRFFRGPAISVFAGNGQFLTNEGPTDASSHQVAYSEATNTVYTAETRGSDYGVASFTLAR